MKQAKPLTHELKERLDEISREYGACIQNNLCVLFGVAPYQRFTFQVGKKTSLDTYRINGDGLLEWLTPEHEWRTAFGAAKFLCKAINGDAVAVPETEEAAE